MNDKEIELIRKSNSTVLVGMDIPTQVSNLMKAKEKLITKGMLPCELKAYRLGVSNCISLLRQLLETDDGDFVVQIESLGDSQEEFMFKDLIGINNGCEDY